MEADLSFYLFSKTIVIPRLLEGMLITLKLSIFSMIGGFILGIILCLMKISHNRFLSLISQVYITLFRGTPLLLQILFIYFALPPLIDMTLDSFPAGVLALSLNAGAYLAEIFRSGIESIHKGQYEASRALGLSHFHTMKSVIIPQTYQRLIPPLVNEFSSLTKETSLVSVISLSELMYTTQRIGAKFLRPWEVYFWAALGYLIIVLFLSYIAHHTEQRLGQRG